MLRADQMDLDGLLALPGNPKGHDIAGISESTDEFGFLERIVVNLTTGHILSGHGRAEALRAMRDAGQSPPGNVIVEGENRWMVPVDYAEVPANREMAVAIALNRWSERGGWVDADLLKALQGIGSTEEDLRGVGFDPGDIESLTAFSVGEGGPMTGNDPMAPAGEEKKRASKPKITVCCESGGEVAAVARALGIAHEDGRTSYLFSETELSAGGNS